MFSQACVKNSVHKRDGHCSGRYASYWNAFLLLSQECIPVGCVPPACWPYPSMHAVHGWGCTCLGGVPAWEGGVPAHRGCICLGAVPARGYLPGGVPAWGAYLPRGGTCPGGCICQGGVPARGMYLPGGTCLGGTCPDTPPCRQTDTCENITFANFVCGW